MKDLIIIGFGGFGREVDWLAISCGRNVAGFLDDSYEPGIHEGYQVLGRVEQWVNYSACEFVVAVGNPRTRKLIVDKMLTFGDPEFATLVHPSAIMSPSVSVGAGSLICAHCTLTVNFSIGEHTILNMNVAAGHDVVIESFVTVAHLVAISGNVTLEDGVELGTNSAIRQGLTMARGSMLGMGGVMTKNADKNMVYVGSPAKEFKKLEAFPS
ncbi:acetyltransferase [Zhongshania sp.]|uniref:acetyltransferase n=1 Tax=Zhongshania sp. TaxID=1971902 RepID=UPI0035677084